jgi:hypothetical protein
MKEYLATENETLRYSVANEMARLGQLLDTGTLADWLTQRILDAKFAAETVALAHALAAIAQRLEPNAHARHFQRITDDLIKALEKQAYSPDNVSEGHGIPYAERLVGDKERTNALAHALTALISRLDPEKAMPLYCFMLDNFTKPGKEYEADPTYYDTVHELQRLLIQIDHTALPRRWGVVAILPRDGASLGFLALEAATSLQCRLPTETLVELLHRPIVIGPARRVVLDALGLRYRRHFRDQWEFVRFAQEQKLPGLDFTGGPKRRLTGVPEPRTK